MPTEDFHIRFSIRTRLLTSFLIIIVGMIIFLLTFNNAFAPTFYMNSRQNNLKDAFYEIQEELVEYSENAITADELSEKLENITDAREVSAIVVDSDWSVLYVNVRGERYLKERLLTSVIGNISTGAPPESVEIIEEKSGYVFQKLPGASQSEDAYELWGTFPTGHTVLCRFTAASIENSVRVMNVIIQWAGLVMLAGAVIGAIIVSRLITNPLKELTGIAKRMSELDFDAKYTRKDTSEIGFLGATMNELSDELEGSITKLKASNLELEKDIKNKEHAQKRQKEFISDITHELKTPIALISGYAEALKEGVASDPESANEYCEIIIDESRKMDKMIKQMLTISELESGRTELSIERFSIVELVSSILNANLINFEKKDIDVEFANQNDEINVWADKIKIEQVITNYITNAINHCSGQNLIKINIEQKEKTVRTHVWNSGENIPGSDIGDIWNKFYKVDKARTRQYGGNGIGLSIVKSIVELHGCECGVDNTEGGVDFWFDLDCNRDV